MLAATYIAFTLYLQYSHSAYIVLGVVSNLEVTNKVYGKDVCRLPANTTPFYKRDLSIQRVE